MIYAIETDNKQEHSILSEQRRTVSFLCSFDQFSNFQVIFDLHFMPQDLMHNLSQINAFVFVQIRVIIVLFLQLQYNNNVLINFLQIAGKKGR